MKLQKINFKEKRYVLPLIALPFILFLSFQGGKLVDKRTTEVSEKTNEFDISLGESNDSILAKNAAYDNAFEKGDGRSVLDGLDKENDSLGTYDDNLDLQQKRYIDSLKAVRSMQTARNNNEPRSYYNGGTQGTSDKDYQRSVDIMNMLNTNASNGNSKNQYSQQSQQKQTEEQDPVKMLKKQLLVMDSLDKAKDPDYQASLKAEERLKKDREKMQTFMNSTLRVSKAALNPSFNSISKNQTDGFIKAVIDEDKKGYLGSRIRFRILEDISIGREYIKKGNFLYAQISGFEQQRVLLNIVSVLSNGKILPINLTVYDTDGMKGLYVPQSQFREMMRELGTNSIQGTQLESGEEGFFTSLASKVFSSTSKTISTIIRQNKAKLKYNTQLYLINEKDLKQNEYN